MDESPESGTSRMSTRASSDTDDGPVQGGGRNRSHRRPLTPHKAAESPMRSKQTAAQRAAARVLRRQKQALVARRALITASIQLQASGKLGAIKGLEAGVAGSAGSLAVPSGQSLLFRAHHRRRHRIRVVLMKRSTPVMKAKARLLREHRLVQCVREVSTGTNARATRPLLTNTARLTLPLMMQIEPGTPVYAERLAFLEGLDSQH